MLVREGGRHSVYENPYTKGSIAVPRHAERNHETRLMQDRPPGTRCGDSAATRRGEGLGERFELSLRFLDDVGIGWTWGRWASAGAILSRMLDATLLLPERPRPLKRAEYERVVAAGVFEDERVELLRGVLVDMSPNNPDHVSPIDRLTMILAPALAGKAIVRIRSPLIAHDESEPEPDVAVVPLGDYRREHPSSALLVIEVAVSSLSKDRKVKGPLYAASSFGEYWIVNVVEKVIEVHRDPQPEGYASVTVSVEGEVVHPQAFSAEGVAVADVFT